MADKKSDPFKNALMGEQSQARAMLGWDANAGYVVQPGDTMSEIAQRLGFPLEELTRANPHVSDPNRIWPGMQLSFPQPTPQPKPYDINAHLRVEPNAWDNPTPSGVEKTPPAGVEAGESERSIATGLLRGVGDAALLALGPLGAGPAGDVAQQLLDEQLGEGNLIARILAGVAVPGAGAGASTLKGVSRALKAAPKVFDELFSPEQWAKIGQNSLRELLPGAKGFGNVADDVARAAPEMSFSPYAQPSPDLQAIHKLALSRMSPKPQNLGLLEGEALAKRKEYYSHLARLRNRAKNGQFKPDLDNALYR